MTKNAKVYSSVGRNFQRGVRSIRQGVWGPLKAPKSPWVFGAKSCNLAISRYFIQTFGKPCFPLLIFKDFHQILHQLAKDFDSHSLNKTSTLIVFISFLFFIRTPPPLATGVGIIFFTVSRSQFLPTRTTDGRYKAA